MAELPNITSLPLDTVLRICRAISLREGPGSAVSRDLAALALTCRSLSEPALDTLWHSIRSLAPLLRTLPEDLCIVAPFVYDSVDGRLPRAGSQFVSATLLLACMDSHAETFAGNPSLSRPERLYALLRVLQAGQKAWLSWSYTGLPR